MFFVFITSLKPLGQFETSLVAMIIEWSSTNYFFHNLKSNRKRGSKAKIWCLL